MHTQVLFTKTWNKDILGPCHYCPGRLIFSSSGGQKNVMRKYYLGTGKVFMPLTCSLYYSPFASLNHCLLVASHRAHTSYAFITLPAHKLCSALEPGEFPAGNVCTLSSTSAGNNTSVGRGTSSPCLCVCVCVCTVMPTCVRPLSANNRPSSAPVGVACLGQVYAV